MKEQTVDVIFWTIYSVLIGSLFGFIAAFVFDAPGWAVYMIVLFISYFINIYRKLDKL